jgi:hypothetical protein
LLFNLGVSSLVSAVDGVLVILFGPSLRSSLLLCFPSVLFLFACVASLISILDGQQAKLELLSPGENSLSGFLFYLHLFLDPVNGGNVYSISFVSSLWSTDSPSPNAVAGSTILVSNPSASNGIPPTLLPSLRPTTGTLFWTERSPGRITS